MSLLRTWAAPALLALHRGLKALTGGPAGIRFLLFHDIGTHERAIFADLVGALHRAGRLATPDKAAAILTGVEAPPSGTLYVLSFDDGFASNAEIATRILDPLDVKALFFVCPGLVDLPAEQQRQGIAAKIFQGKRSPSDLSSGQRLMNWSEIESLRANGHAIGNHTMNHIRLTGLAHAFLEDEIGGAALALSRRLGPIPWFAYTFGDVGSIDRPALEAISRHHRFCRSGVRGPNTPSIHPLALRADHIDLGASPVWRSLTVEGALDPLYGRHRAYLDTLAAGLSAENLDIL